MDVFEPIRAKASHLHAELAAASEEMLAPSLLVEAAVKHLDLELVWLPSGDPALKGARALFDEQSGAICAVDEGNAAERALLIAHEIGHACLHTAHTACSASDIDPSRSTEGAPVGLQRVEDYGARERRELQANVFAREFLFSRTLARYLHLEKALGATAIAALLGLPINLVRQQLLDALLLPVASASTAIAIPPSHSASRSDPSQDAAAAHRGTAYQLQAGPGTGKTSTLVKRVVSLLNEGIDPAAILLLTFSNRAAGELSDRVAAAMPHEASRVWVGTFHAFGLDLVRRYHDRFGLPASPVLFDRSDAIDMLEEILPTLPLVHYRNLWDPALILREILAAISRAKDELVSPARYRELGHLMRDRATDDTTRTAAEKCIEVADIYALYEEALRERDAVDFGDLVMRPAVLLEEEDALRAALHLRHRHVLVDEYQDVNRASARLLRAIAGDGGRRLWVVGDARQSIYRFRGASSANMVRFAADYPGAEVGQLTVNYRSSQEIVSTFAAFAPHMDASNGMLPLSLTAHRGPAGAMAEVRRFSHPDEEAAGVAAAIRELEAAGVALRDQAVLCRSNGRLNDIAAALEARGIPVLHLGSLFERDEVRDLLALLSLAVDPFGDGLVRVAVMPRYNVPLQDVYLTARKLRGTKGEKGNAVSKLVTASAHEELSTAGRTGVAKLASDLASLPSHGSAWDFLASYLLDATRTVAELADFNTVPDRMRAVAIWQFLNFIRDQSPTGAGHPIQRTLDRVRQLVLLGEERDLRQVPDAALHMDAVRLMTVHGSKGLEFEAVHVPGLTVSSFPSQNRGQRCPPPDGMIEGAEALSGVEEMKQAHHREEECLFFVALSRPRTHLRLYVSARTSSGTNRSPSPFLRLIAAQAGDIASPATLALPADAFRSAAVPVTWGTAMQVTDSHLRAYERCPRRFFYTHVLGLGGARKPTAFSRTHDCLYALIAWLAGARPGGEPDLSAAEQEFERIWQTRGPIDHAFAADYRRLASRLIAALIDAGAGRRFREASPLAIDFPNGRLLVEPNEMAELPDGTVVLRRVRTGRRRSDEDGDLAYTLYHLAAQAHLGRRYVIEALHLSDEKVEAITVSAQKIEHRRRKSNTMLADIGTGQFPTELEPLACPRCPHFFICDATPQGELVLT